MAAALFGSIGLGCILVSKLLFDRVNASVLSGAQELGAVIADAARVPGAAEVLALGCESAGALSPGKLRELTVRLEEEARAKGEPPRTIGPEATELVVFCAHPAAGEPSCARVAAAYLSGVKPTKPFVVTVRTGFRESCAERFDPSGASLGPAPSPDLPLLVSPR